MTILQALDRYYDRMAARGEATERGWSSEPIGFVVVLGKNGSVVDVTTHLDDKGKRPRPMKVPKPFNRQGTGSTPYLFWDNTAYALGVGEKDPRKTARDHAASRQLHLAALTDAADPELMALRAFFEQWHPEKFVAPFEPRMLTWNLVFSLDGMHGYIHESPAAQPHAERFLEKYETESVSPHINQCLVTGRMAPPRILHTKIKTGMDTSNSEVPLVSFNARAFESYGKEQAENAPVSSAAVARYTAALTGLLGRVGDNRLRRTIGDATVIFWADTSEVVDEAAAALTESLFTRLVESPENEEDDDSQEAVKIRDVLDAVAAGRPVEDLQLKLVSGTRFHVLGLAPNAARLSVRYWLDDSFEAFAKRLARHHHDLAMEPRPRGWGGKPPSIQRLLVKTTALREKFDNIPPHLAGEVMRAVLAGTPYPRTWLSAAITRLRAGDDPSTGWHAAAIKACLTRSARTEEEKPPVALDPNRSDPPYQLGRLFAVLEAAQYAALGRVNAPIGDRYYAAASSTPARVFGTLLRALKNHVADARKRGQGGWIEPKVAEILKILPPELPRTLKLEEQGRFAIGYYHERATRAPKADNPDDTEEQAQ